MTEIYGDLPPAAPRLTIEQRVERIERILGLDPGMPGVGVVPWPLRQAAVLREAARLWHLTVDEIVGRRNFRELVLARASVVVVLRETEMSYSQIGRLLGSRDHSTIIHLEQIGRRATIDRPGFVRAVEQMRACFQTKPEEQPA